MIYIDARGEACPIPVVKAKRALDTAGAGEVLEIHVDNDAAVQNLRKMAGNQGCPFQSEQPEEKHFVVRITADGSVAETVNEAVQPVSPVDQSGAIAVISSAVMGTGNDELGTVLMKGFIYALSQLEQLPRKILFYNGGVTLTSVGSDSLEDLRLMAEQGVEIMSCGTCLNYYQLTEKLQVGQVCNMYDIAQAMVQAAKIIRP